MGSVRTRVPGEFSLCPEFRPIVRLSDVCKTISSKLRGGKYPLANIEATRRLWVGHNVKREKEFGEEADLYVSHPARPPPLRARRL